MARKERHRNQKTERQPGRLVPDDRISQRYSESPCGDEEPEARPPPRDEDSGQQRADDQRQLEFEQNVDVIPEVFDVLAAAAPCPEKDRFDGVRHAMPVPKERRIEKDVDEDEYHDRRQRVVERRRHVRAIAPDLARERVRRGLATPDESSRNLQDGGAE